MGAASERGLTLTEVTIVTALASVVMLGLVGFYMNSQATWIDASAQAITQREATALVESMTHRVHEAARAMVSPDQRQLDLFDYDPATGYTPTYSYWWDPADSLVHEGPSVADDRGASATSIVEILRFERSDSLVTVDLGMRSVQGRRVRIATAMALFNRR